jgi:GYF domain 2
MDEPKYYVRRQGRVEGPWPFGKLRSEIALRKLGRHHELSEDGNTWTRASEVEGLFSSTSARKQVGHSLTSEPGAAATPKVASVGEELEVELVPVADAGGPAVWYCIVNDVQSGPLTTGQIVAAVEEGRIPLESLVWREGFVDWEPLQSIADITNQFDDSWRYTPASKTATITIASSSRRSPYAGYALWLGIACLLVSWLPLVGFAGVLPVLFGGLTIRDVRRSKSQMGMGAGIAGVVFGSISIVIAVLVILIIGFIAWNESHP